MFEEERPTAVTVIGWAWIAIGVLSIFTGLMGFSLQAWAAAYRLPQPWLFSVAVPILQVCFGVVGIIAGAGLLSFRPWSRLMLEAMSWLLLVLIVGSMVAAVLFSQGAELGLDPFFLVVAVFTTLLYGLPVAFMIRGLRSEKVRRALAPPVQLALRADGQER